jgi:iron complex transport system ATP-binding protein
VAGPDPGRERDPGQPAAATDGWPLALDVVLDAATTGRHDATRLLARAEVPVVRLRSCSVGVRGGEEILAPIDLTIARQSRWVVLGPNGSGKSTLLALIVGDRYPTTGTAELFGNRLGRVDLRLLRRRIGATPPGGRLRLRPEIPVVDLVVSSRDGALEAWWGSYSEAERARAARLLERFGVPGRDRTFGSLSDGEQTRALIARALFPRPELLVLDEPGQGLDVGGREQLVAVLDDLSRQPDGPAIVLVTHALEEIPPSFTHGLLLRGGTTVAAGPLATVLDDRTLSACFGLPLEVVRRNGRWSAAAAGRAEDGSAAAHQE